MKRVVEDVSNQCGLNKYLHTIGISNDLRRPCGITEETGFHIICVCPMYRELRRNTLGTHQIHQTDLPSLDIIKLCNFLKDTNRLT